METNILRHLQLVVLEMLKTFDKICNDNSLKYYLVGGTLLGAICHQGFIPWDNDLDVAMPRKRYEKFVEVCRNGALGDKYSIQCIATDLDYWLAFLKVRKNNTLFEEKSNSNLSTAHKGIFVDAFLLDFCKLAGTENVGSINK